MYELIEAFQNNPSLKKINLEFKNIHDLTTLVRMLEKFKNLQQLYLHGNKLTTIPMLESLRNLKYLDISRNPIKVDKTFLDNLYHMSSLKSLYIDTSEQDTLKIIQNLPKLLEFNGKKIIRQKLQRQTLSQQLQKMSKKMQDQIKRMKQIYSNLCVLANQKQKTDQQNDNDKNNKKQQQFQFVYRDVQEQMNYFYTGLQDKLAQDGVFAYCKNKLTVVLDNLMIRILDDFGDQNIIKVYEEINKIKSQNFDLLLKILFQESYSKHINQQIQKPTNRLRKQTLYQKQIFRLKKQIIDNKKQQRNLQILNNKQQNIVQNILAPKIHSKSNKRKYNKSPSAGNIKNSTIKTLNKNNTSAQPLANIQSRSSLHSNRPLSRSPSQQKSLQKKTPRKDIIQSTNNKSQCNKIVSLQQLQQVIQQVMTEKRKYNIKALQKNQPFQTAEQFIFEYFSRRYGLKQIALNWSLSLIRSIQKYCKQSIQVQIFGKILKNTLYQQYYDQCRQFKKQISKLCKQLKINNNVSQQHFSQLFTYFFSYQSHQTVQGLIKKFKFPLPMTQILYFLQSYKLAFQQKHLKVFIQCFQRVDRNDDSIINLKQMQELLNLLTSKFPKQDHHKKQISQNIKKTLQTFKKDYYIFSQAFQVMFSIL